MITDTPTTITSGDMTATLYPSNSSCVDRKVDLSVTVVVLWSWAAVIVFVINLVVVLALTCNRFLRKRKTMPVLSLGFADMLVGLLGFPTNIFGSKMETFFHNEFPSCRVTSSLMSFLLTAAMLNVLLLTLDRVFLVLYPIRYRIYMTAKKMTLTVFAVWTMSLLMACLAFLGEYVPMKSHTLYFVCSRHGMTRMLVVTLTCIIASVLLCLVFCYAIIVHSVIRNRKKIGHHSSSSSISSQGKTNGGKLTSVHRVVGTERKLTVSSVLVVSLCLIMWTPHLTLSIYELVNGCIDKVPDWVRIMTTTLALLNSGCNGLIYAFRIQVIRRGIFALLTCRCKRADINLGQSTPSSRFLGSPMVSMSPSEKRDSMRAGRISQGIPYQSPTLFRAAVTNHWHTNLKSRSPMSTLPQRYPNPSMGLANLSPLATIS